MIDKIFTRLEAHIKEEERRDLPALETALKSAEVNDNSASLAKEFELTKKFVPTRSHPSAGEKPMFESAAGMLAAPVDKLRDMFKKFPKESAA